MSAYPSIPKVLAKAGKPVPFVEAPERWSQLVSWWPTKPPSMQTFRRAVDSGRLKAWKIGSKLYTTDEAIVAYAENSVVEHGADLVENSNKKSRTANAARQLRRKGA